MQRRLICLTGNTDKGTAGLFSSHHGDHLIFFAIEDPEVRAAAADIAVTGTKLITIVPDLGRVPVVSHVGLDN